MLIKHVGTHHKYSKWIAFALAFAMQGVVMANPPETAGMAVQATSVVLPSSARLDTGGANAQGVVLKQALLVGADGAASALPSGLNRARSGHSATLLADGRVLILGGLGDGGMPLSDAEIFDPTTQRFQLLTINGLLARAQHSASVLTDGRVLITGGIDARGAAIVEAELWNASTGGVERFNARLETARLRHLSALLPSGAVLLWGGVGSANAALAGGEIFDLPAQRFRTITPTESEDLVQALSGTQGPAVQASVPAAEARAVPGNQPLVVRFNKRLSMASLNAQSVTLIGPNGAEPVKVVPVEQGVLLFVWPNKELQPGSRYTLFINGASDNANRRLPLTAIGFDTNALDAQTASRSAVGTPLPAAAPLAEAAAHPPVSQREWFDKSQQPQLDRLNAAERAALAEAFSNGDDEDWIPDQRHFKGRWHAARGRSAMQNLPPLKAPDGATALAGQVLGMHGRPMANVTLRIGRQEVRTDVTGRFLMDGLAAGFAKLEIDGSTANRANAQYGYYAARLELKAGQTTVVPYTIWMPRLDPAGTVRIESPLASDRVITSPRIPGLALHLPAGTVIRDRQGKVVTEINLTAIPVDRPPFPVPDLGVPVYFTVQPGGAVLQSTQGKVQQGAQLYYPNFRGEVPGATGVFWNYDPEDRGWYIYGLGHISADAKQAVPDKGVVIYEFTGAMFNSGTNAPPPPGPSPCGGSCCLPGSAVPGEGAGCSSWGQSAAAGAGNCSGAGDPVDVVTGQFEHTERDMMLPDVVPIDFTRTYRAFDKNSRAFGVGMTHPYDTYLSSAQQYQQVDLILPGGGRVHYVRTSGGTSYSDAVFETNAPGAWTKSMITWNAVRAGWALAFRDGRRWFFNDYQPVSEMVDRNGNLTRIEREADGGTTGKVTRIISPNGRILTFSYVGERVSEITDATGRKVSYTYDTSGRLTEVTDALGSKRIYTWDTVNNRITSIRDPNGNVMVTNVYDTNGRVTQQTLADGSTFLFAYTLDVNGKVTQTDVTDRRGNVRRVAISAEGYITQSKFPLGLPEEQTYSYTYAGGLLADETDALNRKTAYEYDAKGNVTKLTRLAGTAGAVSVAITYDSVFNQPLSMIDANANKTTFSYDATGKLTKVTDALLNVTTMAYDTQGKLTSLTDPMLQQTKLTYELADLSSVTDPLLKGETLAYEIGGLVRQKIDRKGQLSSVSYDSLGRVKRVGFGASAVAPTAFKSVIELTWDKANRLTTIVDKTCATPTTSLNCTSVASTSTITRSWDDLDQLIKEVTPQGEVATTYDKGGRRTSMVVTNGPAGSKVVQPTISYAWDKADRLTQISQAAGPVNGNVAQTVSFTYDKAGRRTQTKLANGSTVNYAYDAAGQTTAIAYKKADATVIGDLSYTYDLNGRRTSVGGSMARVNLPAADVADATYDAANRLKTWGGKSYSYDANGNLIGDGVNAYQWDERNQLKSIAAGVTPVAGFQYDSQGRRVGKTIGAATTGYVYDGANFVQELLGTSLSSAVKAQLLTGSTDETYLRIEGGNLNSVLPDANNNTVRLLDAAQAKVVDYSYEAYGATTADAANGNTQQYTGRENDNPGNSQGLYYYRARYYMPGCGRFISEDPMGWAGGQTNRYAYVGGDPVHSVDPSGLQFVETENEQRYEFYKSQVEDISNFRELLDLIHETMEAQELRGAFDYWRSNDYLIDTSTLPDGRNGGVNWKKYVDRKLKEAEGISGSCTQSNPDGRGGIYSAPEKTVHIFYNPNTQTLGVEVTPSEEVFRK